MQGQHLHLPPEDLRGPRRPGAHLGPGGDSRHLPLHRCDGELTRITRVDNQ